MNHTQIPNNLLDAFVQYNFTARQGTIFFLIIRLTFGIGERGTKKRKESVKINCYRLSRATGIPLTPIKDELEKLMKAQVIFWDRQKDRISLNCYPEKWKLKQSKGLKTDSYNKVLAENIKEFQNNLDTNLVPRLDTKIVSNLDTNLITKLDTKAESNLRSPKEIVKEKETNKESDPNKRRNLKEEGLNSFYAQKEYLKSKLSMER
jgi:hypothetical protein